MKTPLEPQYKKRVGYQAALLGGFSTIATTLLVMGNISTKDEIILRHQEDLQQSLAQVVPAKYYDNNLLENTLQLENEKGETVTIYRGIKNHKLTSLAWQISGQGYSGEMRFILSVDNKGKILGVRVLSHSETPGLGDKMEIEKDNWILGFTGLSLKNTPLKQWKVTKDGGQFDAFSGATITPRGIVKAIVEALNFFAQHKNKLVDIAILKKAQSEPKKTKVTIAAAKTINVEKYIQQTKKITKSITTTGTEQEENTKLKTDTPVQGVTENGN
jgi:H+/Na+-translocating ferredoxin:NAD+ oxidoreductase subunit G